MKKWEINVFFKRMVVGILVLIGSIIVGTVLLTLVYMLPTSVMERNVRSSIDIFYTESVYPMQIQGYKSTQLDNETDAVMLLGAIYDGGEKSFLEQAMRVERIDFSENHSLCVDLIKYAWENQIPDGTQAYTRYWHGYMVWLKPLLTFFDYADIRMFNMIFQIILLFALMVNLIEKGLKKYLLPLAMALVVVNPVATAMSMQFSSVYYMVLISMILILRFHEKLELKKHRYPYFFFMLGIITVFFDFLTYPMAALCMPLILLMVLDNGNWKEKIAKCIILGICFGLGYIGMWAGKWLISSIILQEDVMSTVIGQFTLHSGETEINGEKITKIGAVLRNINVILKWPYVITIGIIGIYCCMKAQWKNILKKLPDTIPFVCIVLVPLAWLYITSSHASWCYWYTYRGLMATIFGIFCILVKLAEEKAESEGQG